MHILSISIGTCVNPAFSAIVEPSISTQVSYSLSAVGNIIISLFISSVFLKNSKKTFSGLVLGTETFMIISSLVMASLSADYSLKLDKK
ncbi:MAG: hypothetical protein ACTSVI_01350 [Promethearchaeota archaeon]